MTRTLYIDTAVHGRWLYREGNTDARQPHLVRLAVLHVDDGVETHAWCRLIRPKPGWLFEVEAVVANGISERLAAVDGIEIEEAVGFLHPLLAGADEVVAYNLDFHRRVLERSYYDVKREMPPPNWTEVCAMRECTAVVKKPRTQPGGGYAWPKQAEAFAFFSGGRELPAVNTDPLERGLALVRSVRMINEGTMRRGI